MNILEQIKNSVYGKVYYKETVLNESSGQSVKYLAKVSLLVALLGVVIIVCLMPSNITKIKVAMSKAISYYPSDLTITINKGIASVNQPEPYFIKIPDALLNANDSKPATISNILTINTSEPFNVDKFKEYGTIFLLTQKEIVSIDNNGGLKISPIASIPNVAINKAWLTEKEAYLIKMIPVMTIVVIVLAYIFLFMMMFVGALIILFFYALIVWALLKLKGMEQTYKKSYQIALHATTLILFINLIGLFIQPINNFLFKIAILILIVYLNFDKISTISTPAEILTPTENKEVLS